jgi:hypothetical protein
MAVAGVVTLVGLTGVVGSLGYLHLAPTGLSPVRSAVSEYGITDFRSGYRVATIAFAVAGFGLAFGVDRAAAGRGHVVVALLVVFGASRAAISWFPMDAAGAPGAPETTTGRTHGVLALAAFAAAMLAALRLGRVLARGGTWHALGPVSTSLGSAMAVCLVGMALARSSPAVRARFGAIERAFYVAAITWFAVFGVACL